MTRAFARICSLLLIAIGVAAWIQGEHARKTIEARVFSATAGCPIIIPRDASDAERGAARMLREALVKSSALDEAEFPIVHETSRRNANESGGIWVGATRRGAGLFRETRRAPYDSAVGVEVVDGAVLLRSERRESIEVAASWFLREFLGANWFMPGPLGEVIPKRSDLVLDPGTIVVRPGFLSRDLGPGSGPGAREWYVRNGLERRFHHSHNLDNIFRPEDLRRQPEMAPTRYGRKHFPAANDYNWQPNLVSPLAIEHAAAAANRAFAADPDRLSFSLSANDSARFDETGRAVVSPPRFFRTRPDFSDLIFGFTNAVAKRVARAHPDRWLPAYAYYWAENTPRFPVAANVVPYLTADRAQWFDPAFAAEDKALIERWTKSGAEIVGAYDYYYGAPFLIPRPIVTAVRESIPFMHDAGVRAFYAEMSPNWALDGPKAWLAAQLLWAPRQDPAALLDTYYREFWAEAAAPMRRFYELCDRAWLEQPRPGYWIKYFQDEQQAGLFPATLRAELDVALREARRLASSKAVRARVAFVTRGWAVCAAFVTYSELRDAVGRLGETAPPETLAREWQRHVEARWRFLSGYATLVSDEPLALAAQSLEMYVRNDPSGRVVRRLLGDPAHREFLASNRSVVPGNARVDALERLFGSERNVLVDPGWQQVRRKAIGGATDFEWVELGGVWQASGEPAERRNIEWLGNPTGAGQRLRLSGCRQEFLVQWRPANAGDLFAAEIDVRAKVSPGNQTFLIVNFLDEKFQRVGGGHVDRLPAAEDVQSERLCVIARAPENARYVGVGVRVIHQVGEDFAEFAGASLKRVSE